MKKKILLVDDSSSIQMACRRMMTALDIEPLKAKNGEDALQRIREYPDIDVVLLD